MIRNAVFVIAFVLLLVFLLDRFAFKEAGEEDGKIDFRTDGSKPRGIRNNNPGNIKFSAGNNWLGKIPYEENSDEGKTFEQFKEYRYGIRAMVLILISYMLKHNLRNITDIIDRYTTGDSTATKASYVVFVSDKTGITTSEYLSPNKATLRSLVKAMTFRENGEAAVSDSQFEEGYKLAFAKA